MGHSRSEVVFTENYVFGELKCDIEIKKKKNKTSTFVHINYSF